MANHICILVLLLHSTNCLVHVDKLRPAFGCLSSSRKNSGVARVLRLLYSVERNRKGGRVELAEPCDVQQTELDAAFIGLPGSPSAALQEASGGSIAFRLISDNSIIKVYLLTVDTWHLSSGCS